METFQYGLEDEVIYHTLTVHRCSPDLISVFHRIYVGMCYTLEMK